VELPRDLSRMLADHCARTSLTFDSKRYTSVCARRGSSFDRPVRDPELVGWDGPTRRAVLRAVHGRLWKEASIVPER
jgi:hypothetical protein